MGNWISENIIKSLEKFVLDCRRRKAAKDTHSNQSQGSSPHKSPSNKHVKQKSKPLSVPITSTTVEGSTKKAVETTVTTEPLITTTTAETVTTETKETVASSITCSDFYMACRNNKLEEVKKLLENMTLDQVDQIEPNGSTALHIACYKGHQDIVKLLLEARADRAIPNKYNNLPFDEALNREIQGLFFRIPSSTRLVSDTGAIEWELVDEEVLDKAEEERKIIKSRYEDVPIDKMFERIEKNYIGKGLTHFDGIENIRRVFQKAPKEQNPLWIIKAYTAETDFYKVLNKEIAGDTNNYINEQRYIIALLSHHPILNELTFTGTSYRVMQLNPIDLEKYQVNTLLMTKSFLSSSLEEKLAACFLCRHELAKKESGVKERYKANGNVIKEWVICVYNIKHQRTALHIENLSQYAMEGEILIMPYTVFKVKKIQQVQPSCIPNELLITKIELEECDQYFT